MSQGGGLRRTKPLVRTTPLRSARQLTRIPLTVVPRLSVKRTMRGRREEVNGRAVVYARSGGVCECCGEERATEWHHRKPRSLGGRWNPANGMHLASDHHRWITEHPAEATRNGWTVPSHRDPALTPLLLRGVWVLLDDAGNAVLRDHFPVCPSWQSTPDECTCALSRAHRQETR